MRRTGFLVAGGCVLAGLAALVWLLVFARPWRSNDDKKEVRVAAAADLRYALDDMVAAFQRKHPDVDVKVTYGASGNFYAQLSNRAPFDLFLSADVEYPRKLIEQNLADRDTEFLYAVGHLVLWVPKASALDVGNVGAKALLDPSVQKIAMANPKHAPYGRAAEAALKSLRIYEQVKDKLVLGENVAQAAQFVQSGSADIGIIALSLAVAPALRDQGRYWELPLDTYPRLEQGGVILSWAQDRPAAEKFRSFLLSDEGKAVLKRYGFFLPGG
jgi:molybdate transport system substrate-binding protein